MKTLVDYIIEAKKSLENNLFKEIAQALVDKANEGSYSFWEETDDFTGKYRRYKNDPIKFENILVKDLIKILSSYDNLSDLDYEDFTNDIQSIFVGDGNGETDYGDNAHDEILEIVEDVFKKFNIGKKEDSIKKEDSLMSLYKKSKKCLYLFIKNGRYYSSNIIQLEVKQYDKITKNYIMFKDYPENKKFYKQNEYNYLSNADNIFILPIDDSIKLLEEMKNNKGKIKIYKFLINSSYKSSNQWRENNLKEMKNIEFETIGAFDRLIEELKK